MRSLVLSIVLLVASPVFGRQPKAITNSIGMKLALILPGSFWMGSPDEEKGRLSNETQHLVTISHWFYIGACEVTQPQRGRPVAPCAQLRLSLGPESVCQVAGGGWE